MTARRLVRASLLAAAMLVAANAMPALPQDGAASGRRALEVFVRADCPHCARAKEFLSRLSRERSDLDIVYRAVDDDPAARDDLIRLSQQAGVWPPGVPTFHVNHRVLVGFDDAEHSGRTLIALIDGSVALQPDRIETALFGTLSATRLGLPFFTLALGLIDGFNPCAMWVLLFLLALLVRLNDRRRMALIAGTFIFVSGAVYYVFMAAWLNLFLAIGMSDGLRWTLAGIALSIGAVNVKDGFVPERGLALSIPTAARPGLYARMRRVLQAQAMPASLAAVAVLAVLVNFVEFLCTAGFPAIYTAVLAQHDLGAPAHYAYLGLYIVGYIADDTLMVTLAVVALGSRKLTMHAGRMLKLVSGMVMLALGAVMLLRPRWLM